MVDCLAGTVTSLAHLSLKSQTQTLWGPSKSVLIREVVLILGVK